MGSEAEERKLEDKLGMASIGRETLPAPPFGSRPLEQSSRGGGTLQGYTLATLMRFNITKEESGIPYLVNSSIINATANHLA